jgi:O-antigen ligase
LLLIPLALTSSRAALFLFPLGLVTILGLRRLLQKRVLALFAILGVVGLLAVAIYYRNRPGTLVNDLDPRNLVAEQLDNVTSPGRLRYLAITYELIMESPLTALIGYGPGTYASTAGSGLRAPLLVQVTNNAYSPNIQSELAAVLGEYGILGTALLFGLYLSALLLNFRNSGRVHSPFWRGIGLGMRGVSVMFLAGVFTERLWEIQPIPYYFWFFTAALFLAARHEASLDR